MRALFTTRQLFTTLFLLFIGLLAASALSAWTGPTATAPGGNVAAPINVGATDQVKNAGISVNSLAVFGSQYIQNKLGVGRVSPITALDVNGSMRLADGGEVCQAVTAGTVKYNATSQVLQMCDGSTWRTVKLASPSATNVIVLTSGTTWSVPSEWNNANNTIEVVGGGGGGGPGNGNSPTAGGGGGGGYSKVTNLALTPGSSVYIHVGNGGGEGGAGGDTWFSSVNAAPTSASQGVLAKGGAAAGGAGGSSASGVGTTKYSGGNGGASGSYGASGGGGGGAAGLHGAGASGGGGSFPGAGGAGGRGDAGSGGSGGGANASGGVGTEWDASTGSGGGGGGSSSYDLQTGYCPGPAGSGGQYGSGGGGGAYGPTADSCAGGSGRQGVIIITYTTI